MLNYAHLPVSDGALTLRRLEPRDAVPYAEATDDALIRRFAHLPDPEYTPASVASLATGIARDGLLRGDLGLLTIASAEDDRLVGSVVLFDVTETTAEVGFWVHPEARGSGVAARALELACSFAAKSGLTLLTARTVHDNVASKRVLTGAGFTASGTGPDVAPSGEAIEVARFELKLRPEARGTTIEIRDPLGVDEHPTLVNIWRSWVLATHDFLAPEHRDAIEEQLAPAYFPQVSLAVATLDGVAVGFSGVAGDSLEMLFVSAASRGSGVGRALIEHAMRTHEITRIDVNEQNPRALGFYEHLGFTRVGRSETDAQGLPYPIIHLERKTS